MGSWVLEGGQTSKLKMVMALFFHFLIGNKFALIHVFFIIGMCNEVKTKASLFQEYILCLDLWQNIAAKTIGNYVFSSLNTSGVRKCKY